MSNLGAVCASASRDVSGEWGMATQEMENHFDVPIKKK